jgi:predicted CXXCH cytochrome family protein
MAGALAIVLALTGSAWAQATIVGSAHDFSSMAWSGNEICKPCHTPHNAKPQEVSGRLWNHELTTATYTLNGHGTDVETGTAVNDMDRISRLCLSCHDGTVALDSFGGVNRPTEGVGVNVIPTAYKLGTDLSDDHPVGKHAVYSDVDYRNSDGTTQRYKAADYTKNSVTHNGVRLTLYDSGETRNVTYQGTTTTYKNLVISCYTCHTAHGSANPSLLRASNVGSQLCLTCHNK